MKIRGLSGLTDLFVSLGEKSSSTQAQSKTADTSHQNAQAVRLANDFGRSGEAVDTSRATRVQEIKAQVERNEYNPDSREVAVALAKELFY